jgi:hypothetical protein
LQYIFELHDSVVRVTNLTPPGSDNPTLSAGNHYAEIQVVDEIYDKHAAVGLSLPRGVRLVTCATRLVTWGPYWL